jgi:hypothetical protein
MSQVLKIIAMRSAACAETRPPDRDANLLWEGGSPFPPHRMSQVLKIIAMRSPACAETRPPDRDANLLWQGGALYPPVARRARSRAPVMIRILFGDGGCPFRHK